MRSDCRVSVRKHKFKLVVLGLLSVICLLLRRSHKGVKTAPNDVPRNVCRHSHKLIVENTQQQNIDFVKTYVFPNDVVSNFQGYFGLAEEVVPNTSRDVPVIGTAASSNHFTESLLMLENIQQKLFRRYEDLRVYYYDLGLTSWQRNRVMEYPRVELRHFPFSDVPEHVGRLNGYAWKPIIIQMLLQEFGFVLWMDASVRFTSSNQDRLFQAAKNHGVIYRPGFYSLVVHTDNDTFSFLNEDPCLFQRQNEVEANMMLVYRTQFTNDFFMKPVVLCALSFGCMLTKRSHRMHDCTDKTNPHSCHRFDQSVFSILISRLYRSETTNQVTEYSEIHLCRGIEVSIFGETINRLIVGFVYWLTSTPDICFE